MADVDITKIKWTFTLPQRQVCEAGLIEKSDFLGWGILAYIAGWELSGNGMNREVDGKRYYWIHLPTLIRACPMFRIKDVSAISRRVKLLVKEHLLESVVENQMLFVRLSDKVRGVFADTGYQNGTVVNQQEPLSINNNSCSTTTEPLSTNNAYSSLNNPYLNSNLSNTNTPPPPASSADGSQKPKRQPKPLKEKPQAFTDEDLKLSRWADTVWNDSYRLAYEKEPTVRTDKDLEKSAAELKKIRERVGLSQYDFGTQFRELWTWVCSDFGDSNGWNGWLMNCRTPNKLNRKDQYGIYYWDALFEKMIVSKARSGNQQKRGWKEPPYDNPEGMVLGI